MAPKRARRQTQQGPPLLSAWGAKPLSTFPPQFREALYREKMSRLSNLTNRIVAERHVNVDDFRGFGLVEGFGRLGWEGILTINPEGESKVYVEELLQFMATLEREDGDNPPWTTTLTGLVNETPVVLSCDTIREIIDIDTLPVEQYERISDAMLRSELKGDDWLGMLAELFDVPHYEITHSMSLEVDSMKPLPRLLEKLLVFNVVPRQSDRMMVRGYDIRPLYALVTGQRKFSLCQLIMLNVWDAHEFQHRSIIPHARLLTQLLLNAGAVPGEAESTIVTSIPFNRHRLKRGEFAFTETRTRFILTALDSGAKHVVMKPQEDIEMEEEAEERGDQEHEHEHFRQYGIPRVNPTRPIGYDTWENSQKVIYDTNNANWTSLLNYLGRRAREDEEERQRRLAWEAEESRRSQLRQEVDAAKVYFQQKYRNEDYNCSERRRHHHDYVSGLPYQETPGEYDYTSLPPYGSNPQLLAYPGIPQPPFYRSSDSGASSSSQPQQQDTFEMGSLARGLYEGIFGQPYPPPGDHQA